MLAFFARVGDGTRAAKETILPPIQEWLQTAQTRVIVRKQWEFSRFSWSSQPHVIAHEQTEVICRVVSGISSYLYQFLTEFGMRVHVCWVFNTGDFKLKSRVRVRAVGLIFLFFFFCNLTDFYYLFSFRY